MTHMYSYYNSVEWKPMEFIAMVQYYQLPVTITLFIFETVSLPHHPN